MLQRNMFFMKMRYVLLPKLFPVFFRIYLAFNFDNLFLFPGLIHFGFINK